MPLSELRALSWGYPEQLSWHLRHVGANSQQYPPQLALHGQANPIPSDFLQHISLSQSWAANLPQSGARTALTLLFSVAKSELQMQGGGFGMGRAGNSILLATGASSAAQSTETNELEEAFPLPRALTRELRGQELKNEEERKRDRKIHLPSRNPQSRGHLEVIFHRAESCFWPFSRHYFLLKPHRFGCWEVFPPSSGCWKSSISLGAGLNFHTLLCVLG